MIRFEKVRKRYPIRTGYKVVLDGIDLTVGRGEKIGILGRNGAGKSTTIRLLSGAELADGGRIERSMSVSWPIAFAGAFQGSLTGRDNLRLICRIYGRQIDDCIDTVLDFSELGQYFDEPVKTYSSGMRARLAFALSLVIEFDCFLIDEVVAVGDSRFHEKCHQELFIERADRAFVIVSHNVEYIRAHCDKGFVLHNGRMMSFSNVEDAISYHEAT